VADTHYCTYFDHRYAALGLAMLRSVREQGGTGPVWALCLDAAAEHIMRGSGLDDVQIVSLADIERHFPELETARANRSMIEYYFTLTPHIVRFVFDAAPEANRVAYLDCDLYFFGPVGDVWSEAGDAPAAIIPHNFHKSVEHLAKYGEYNVGWVSFTRSPQGLRCLDFWADSCREWCHDFRDGDRFADQGYLGRFKEFAPDLAVLRHKGFNLGPWSIGRYTIRLVDGRVRVDDDPLVFFHFTGFKKGFAGRWFNSHRGYRTRNTAVIRDYIYRPYLQSLVEARADVAALLGTYEAVDEGTRAASPGLKRAAAASVKSRLYKALERGFWTLDLVTGYALKEPAARSDR
jgi:hypothetical protein